MINEIIAIVATIMGTIMSLAGIPQIHRILKRKSSNDVSISLVVIFLVGVIVWITYGLIFKDYPIIISNGVGIVVWSGTLATVIKYRNGS